MKTIIGYADRIRARPGDRLRVMVHCEQGGHYRADLVRLICGDDGPYGGGF